jgi:hypothetical protein
LHPNWTIKSEAIRDARAKDPLISVVALQEQLERQFNRTFTRKYIAKLAMKVERQALQVGVPGPRRPGR